MLTHTLFLLAAIATVCTASPGTPPPKCPRTIPNCTPPKPPHGTHPPPPHGTHPPPPTNGTPNTTCAIQFDGRIPAGSKPALFDTSASPFNTVYIKGSENFSQIIELPTVTPSLFDKKTCTLPFEITIDDKSIFQPGPDNRQIGFRRAEALILSNSGSDASTLGLKTLHFSLKKDAARPLNTSHEYQLVFLEDSSYSTNQFALKTGTILGGVARADPDRLVLQGNIAKGAAELFSVKFKKGTWQNFGLVLDFDANTTQVLYSEGAAPLAPATRAVANDLSGQGQYHFGILKKPTATEGVADITKGGFQPAGIDEGVIFGGVFMEDGCTSLS